MVCRRRYRIYCDCAVSRKTTEPVVRVPSTAISAAVCITGLEVVEVNVTVNDLRPSDEEEPGTTAVACVEWRWPGTRNDRSGTG